MAANDMVLHDGAVSRGFSASPWFALSVLFLGQMLAIGAIAYGFGLLAKPIASEFALQRADMNIGLMALIVGMALFSPLIGRALDRLPGRVILCCGALLFGAGCLVIVLAQSLVTMLAAAFLLVAFGGVALGPLTSSTITARLFTAHRGRALGIVSVSASVGGMLLLPAMAFLVEGHGWRAAVGAVGLLVVILLGGLGWLVRTEPAIPSTDPARSVSADERWTTARCLRTTDFWAITVAVGLTMAVDQALLVSLIPYGTDRGFPLQSATFVVSLISGTAIAGKIAIGALTDRIDPRWIFLAIIVLTGGFLALLTLKPAYPVLLGAAAFLGIGFGGTMPLWATFIANRFGTACFGAVMGLMVPLQMPMNIAALRYVGDAYDRAGNYDTAFLVFLAVLVVAGLAILPLRRPRAR